MVEPGLQYTYILPLPVYTLIGAEILQGENNTLFGQDAANGPHAFTGYVKSSFDLSDYSTLLLGVSAVGGKTQTDTVQPNSLFTGNSVLYDLEMYYKWKPSTYESFSLQSEYMLRNQYGNLQDLGATARRIWKEIRTAFTCRASISGIGGGSGRATMR